MNRGAAARAAANPFFPSAQPVKHRLSGSFMGIFRLPERGALMANILWTVIVILFVLWLIGFAAHIGGSLIHLLLVVALIAFVFNLITGRSQAV